MGNKQKCSNENESINPYEKQRMKTLEANAAIMKAKGFNKSLLNKTLQEKYDLVSKNVLAESSELEDCQEVPRHLNEPRGKSGKKTLIQTLPMAEFKKKRTRERQQKTKTAKTNQGQENRMILAQHKEKVNEQSIQAEANQRAEQHQEPSQNPVQDKGSQQKQNQQSLSSLNQHQRSYCAPGTMSLYLNMKKKRSLSDQRIQNISDIQQPNDDSFLSNDEMDLTEDEPNSFDLETNAPNVESNAQNVMDENENTVTKQKRHRGRTILANLHGRTMDERDVVLNDLHQVVGPTSHVAKNFARFLGTLARNSNYAPLDIIDWHYMPTKDQILEYIKTKFIIPEEAKETTLSSIGTKWRNFKSNLKRAHFSEDATMEEMLENRPKDVPECQFKELLLYWSTQEAKLCNVMYDESKRNKESRSKQSDLHTMGPVSIAIKRQEMQQNDPDKRCPTQAELYIESRKRTDGRTYLTQNDETLQNIEKMKEIMSLDDGSGKCDPYHAVITKKEHSGRLRMYGHGVTKSSLKSKDPKNSFILPSIFLEGISQQRQKVGRSGKKTRRAL